jgi:hypothetical protein
MRITVLATNEQLVGWRSKPQSRSSCPLVEKSPTPLLIGWIRNQAEHYGKLVSNYRAVGIVPPSSRTPASQ